MKSMQIDALHIDIYDDKQLLGESAAAFVADTLRAVIAKKGAARLILATGASQFEFVEALKMRADVDWPNITVFHLDEYKGMPMSHPASFRRYLAQRILNDVKPKQVHYLQGDAPDVEAEARRYAALLAAAEIDVACIGIGENGHIAFNDPPVADFDDPKLVKVVELDELCRRQQLGEGWFPTLADVPTHALSLTIPAIMRSRTISCVVPDQRKANAVYCTLRGPIETACPASILRRHPHTRLFLDGDSAAKILRD